MTVLVRAVIATASIAVVVVVRGHAQVERRHALPLPDIPGFHTLKADFHLHSVFSDGAVWPTVHVMEAWRDGLDAISLTEHLEYRPHTADVMTPIERAYAAAKPLADQLGIILIPGAEITRPAWPEKPDGATAHFNALFVTDWRTLEQPSLLGALRRARDQGAFVFWNHPGFRVAKAELFPAIAEAYDQKLFQGMELVNGPNFYPEAFPWIESRRLTILANSDAHDPVPPRERGGLRPMTLLFARTRDREGVKDALIARRTAAWMGGELWGNEDQLKALFSSAVRFLDGRVAAGTFAFFRVQNSSALSSRFTVRHAPDWLRFEPAAIAAEGESLLRARVMPDAPAGSADVEIALELLDVHHAPRANLLVRLPLRVTVSR